MANTSNYTIVQYGNFSHLFNQIIQGGKLRWGFILIANLRL